MEPPAYQYPQQPASAGVYPPQPAPVVVYPPQPTQAAVYPPQPGQTNVVVSPAPVQSSYIVQNAGVPQEEGGCSGTSVKFNAKGGMVTGIIQLIIAILAIILGVVSIVIGYGLAAFGIWAGFLFFMPAGILGIISKSRSTCVITGYLVICILCTVMSFIMLCYEGDIAGSVGTVCSLYSYYNYGFCRDFEGVLAIHAVLAVLAFVEFVVSIAGAAVCCGGLRCCCASPSPTATTTTTTTSYAYGGNPNPGYVVQPGQPGQPEQPAPYGNKM